MTAEKAPNFARNMDALLIGMLIGEMQSKGIPGRPVRDEDGDYLPQIDVWDFLGHHLRLTVEVVEDNE